LAEEKKLKIPKLENRVKKEKAAITIAKKLEKEKKLKRQLKME
jgi:hypothetical protein